MLKDRHRTVRLLLGVCATLALTVGTPLGASVYGLMSDAELADEAALIAELEFLDSSNGWYGDLPSTEYVARIVRLMKGRPGTGGVMVRVPGGEISPGLSVRVLGSPVFPPGSRALVFLAPNDDGSYSILHNLMGLFELHPRDGRVVAFRASTGVHVVAESGRPAEMSTQRAPRRTAARPGPRKRRRARRVNPLDRPLRRPAQPAPAPTGLGRPQALELSVVAALPELEWGLARDYEGFAAWLTDRSAGIRRAAGYYLPRVEEEQGLAAMGGSNVDRRWFVWDLPPRYRMQIKWNKDCGAHAYCGSSGAFSSLLNDTVEYWNGVGSIRYDFTPSGNSTNKIKFEGNTNSCCRPNGTLKGQLNSIAFTTSAAGTRPCGAGGSFEQLTRVVVKIRPDCDCWLDGRETEQNRIDAFQTIFGQTLGLDDDPTHDEARARYRPDGTCSG